MNAVTLQRVGRQGMKYDVNAEGAVFYIITLL